MNFFKQIENERSEFIPLFQIIHEIAYLETVTPNEVAASLHRELEIPFDMNLNLYHYDITDGFVGLTHKETLDVLERVAKTWVCPLPAGVAERAKNIVKLGYPTYEEYRKNWKTERIVIIKQIGNHDFHDYDVGIKATEFVLFLKSIKFPTLPPSIANLSTPSIKKIILTYNSSSLDSLEDNCTVTSDNSDNCPKNEMGAQWQEFHGRETALLMIAGMAVALEKAGGKYVRAGKMNKSAIAESAKKAINDFGLGTTLTDRALRDLLNTALDRNLTKLEE
ncbi:hypothetical protein [Buttiauxella izardii]|uniref:Uncharacterized protein n=1 Tax=Buttiauxella izardii TaxID=82991 RepID=A0A3A5JTJ1_9ENTR|nr:hypothetical protein [Buttiauxella izardii]RJT26063.1 hypothetical protein D6029_06745 [Buttiauxella izardii]